MLSPENILSILKTECGYHDGDSILVGVSGGADSIALLHLLNSAKIPVAAAHVNYGLRGEESDGDEKFVSEFCAKLNVPLYIRRTNPEDLRKYSANLQSAAREFRYIFFNEIVSKESVKWIGVAHHSDDQFETVLMNFMRGSGLNGLSGMKPVNEDKLRPLLNFSREEIENYLRTVNCTWRNDSSNDSDDYLRNRIRNNVVPALHSVDERNSLGWKNSIEHIRQSNELLHVLIQPWISLMVRRVGADVLINKNELIEFQFPHLLLNWVLHENGFGMQFSQEEFMKLIQQQPGKKYVKGTVQLTVDRDDFVLSEVPADVKSELVLKQGIDISGWTCNPISPTNPEKYSGFEALINVDYANNQLVVRTWQSGDKFQPLGFHGTRKVSDILTDMKVPAHEKESYPILICNQEIVWVPGYRIAEKFRVTDQTKTALHIKWNR